MFCSMASMLSFRNWSKRFNSSSFRTCMSCSFVSSFSSSFLAIFPNVQSGVLRSTIITVILSIDLFLMANSASSFAHSAIVFFYVPPRHNPYLIDVVLHQYRDLQVIHDIPTHHLLSPLLPESVGGQHEEALLSGQFVVVHRRHVGHKRSQ